jgi:hypothetical protein
MTAAFHPPTFSPHHFFQRWSRVALLGLALACGGCAHRYQITTPADADRKLPARRGEDRTSIMALTPWKYLGSHYQTHEFRYYYDRDNALYSRRVSIAREHVVLRLEERPYQRVSRWVVGEVSGETFYFVPVQY